MKMKSIFTSRMGRMLAFIFKIFRCLLKSSIVFSIEVSQFSLPKSSWFKKINKFIFLFVLMTIFSKFTYAQTGENKGITFQAVIKDPDGVYPTVSGLSVVLQILDPAGICVLREESHSGVSISNGYVNLAIGADSASVPVSANPQPVLSLSQVMDNSKPINGFNCTYTPSSGNARKLRIKVRLPRQSGLSEPVVADFNMRSVAYAVNSETLDGKSKDQFIQVSNNLTQQRLESFLTSLTSISGNSVKWDGTSFISYDPRDASNISSIPESAISSVSYSKLTNVPSNISQFQGLTCLDGKILKKVSGVWACSDESGLVNEVDPTVQSFAKNSPGTGLNVNASNQLEVKYGTSSTTAARGDDVRIDGAFQASTSLGGDLSGTLPNPKVEKIKGQAVTATGTFAGQVLRYAGGNNWTPGFVAMTDLKSSVTGSNSFANSCSANQTLTYNSVGDIMSCQNISITKSQVSDLPSFAPSATVDATNANNITSGELSTARLPASVTNAFWQESSGNVSRLTGKVGIGTSNPSNLLSVAGVIESTSGGIKFPDGTTQTTAATSSNSVSNLTDASTISVNASTGEIFDVTLGGDRTLGNPTNLINGKTYHFRIKQDAVGNRKLSWGTSYKFSNASIPFIKSTPNEITIASFLSDGTSLFNIGSFNLTFMAPLVFNDYLTAFPSSVIYSSILMVSGFNGSMSISISGAGSPQYRTCLDGACNTVIQNWTSSPGSVAGNNYVQISSIAPSDSSTVNNVSLTISSLVSQWNIQSTGGFFPPAGSVLETGAVTTSATYYLLDSQNKRAMLVPGSAITGSVNLYGSAITNYPRYRLPSNSGTVNGQFTAIIIGGGGAGGYNYANGGSGGGGGYILSQSINASNQSVTFSIGAGGVRNTSKGYVTTNSCGVTNSQSGGSSSFTAGSTYTANGGNGGYEWWSCATPTPGGSAGGYGGPVNSGASGQNGASASGLYAAGGLGGVASGTTGNGGGGGGGFVHGGVNAERGGTSGTSYGAVNPGYGGTGFGSGGGGGCGDAGGGTTSYGGAGAPGAIILQW